MLSFDLTNRRRIADDDTSYAVEVSNGKKAISTVMVGFFELLSSTYGNIDRDPHGVI